MNSPSRPAALPTPTESQTRLAYHLQTPDSQTPPTRGRHPSPIPQRPHPPLARNAAIVPAALLCAT